MLKETTSGPITGGKLWKTLSEVRHETKAEHEIALLNHKRNALAVRQLVLLAFTAMGREVP